MKGRVEKGREEGRERKEGRKEGKGKAREKSWERKGKAREKRRESVLVPVSLIATPCASIRRPHVDNNDDIIG